MKKIALIMLACVIPAGLCARQVKPAAILSEEPAAETRGGPEENGRRVETPKEERSSALMPGYLVQAAATSRQAVQAGGFLVGKKHLVVKGDTLWDLSGKYYNDPFQWGRIYNANSNTVANPDRINPDEELIIPDINETVAPYLSPETPPEGSVERKAPGAGRVPGGYAPAAEKVRPQEPGEILPDFERDPLSAEMPEQQKEWADGIKIVPDSWREDGEITGKLKGDGMEDSFSLIGEAVEILMDGPGIVKPGDHLTVYLIGGDAHDKSGNRLGRELQPAGLAEVVSVDGLIVSARVIDATTAISKGYIVKKK